MFLTYPFVTDARRPLSRLATIASTGAKTYAAQFETIVQLVQEKPTEAEAIRAYVSYVRSGFCNPLVLSLDARRALLDQGDSRGYRALLWSRLNGSDHGTDAVCDVLRRAAVGCRFDWSDADDRETVFRM